MSLFSISFADATVGITGADDRALEFLSFLFSDIPGIGDDDEIAYTLSLTYDPDTNTHRFSDGSRTIHRGELNAGFAAHVYDHVIYHLLDHADNGIALHAGAVAANGRVIILPGISGAGKSSLTAWLTSRGCSYQSDELIYISATAADMVFYFSRPICLKAGSVPLLAELTGSVAPQPVLIDNFGAVVPHRLVNPEFFAVQNAPDIILFPDFQPTAEPRLEPIGAARATTMLMGCLVNARNLEQHGFRQIIRLAESTTAFRLSYRSFEDAATCLSPLFAAA